MRKTFALCVVCFGLTCSMTGGLLMLWGHGMERVVFTDVCTHYTHWSCTQWDVDGVLVLVIIPIKFCYGMMHGWTVPMLFLLAVFQSANLALLGCFSRSFAPIATQTFLTFWVALVTIWLACICREGTLRSIERTEDPRPQTSSQHARVGRTPQRAVEQYRPRRPSALQSGVERRVVGQEGSRTHQDRITLASQRMPSSTSLGTGDPLTVAKSICDAPIERDARLENQPGSIHSESFIHGWSRETKSSASWTS